MWIFVNTEKVFAEKIFSYKNIKNCMWNRRLKWNGRWKWNCHLRKSKKKKKHRRFTSCYLQIAGYWDMDATIWRFCVYTVSYVGDYPSVSGSLNALTHDVSDTGEINSPAMTFGVTYYIVSASILNSHFLQFRFSSLSRMIHVIFTLSLFYSSWKSNMNIRIKDSISDNYKAIW